MPENGPPSNGDNHEPAIELGEYSGAIETFYGAHDQFLDHFGNELKKIEIIDGRPQLEGLDFDISPLVTSLGELLTMVHEQESDWNGKAAMTAGLMWGEQKRRKIRLNDCLRNPLQYSGFDSGIAEIDSEEKSKKDVEYVESIKNQLDVYRDQNDDGARTEEALDKIVIVGAFNEMQKDMQMSLHLTIRQYIHEKREEIAQATTQEFKIDDLDSTKTETSKTKDIARLVGKEAKDVAKFALGSAIGTIIGGLALKKLFKS